MRSELIDTKRIPKNITAEETLLAMIIVSKRNWQSMMVDICKNLKVDDFFDQNNQIIFSACVEMFMLKEPLDATTLMTKLSDRGKLEMIGGALKLSNIMSNYTGTEFVQQYIDMLLDKSNRRKAMELGYKITDMAVNYSEGSLNEEIKGLVVSSLSESKNTSTSLLDGINEVLEQQQFTDKMRNEGKDVIGWKTFPSLDRMTDGIYDGRLYVISGYSSTGKSHLALTMFHSLIEQKARVKFISLEMSERQLLFRLIAQRAKISIKNCIWRWNKDKNCPLTNEELARLDEAIEFFKRDDIYIERSPNFDTIMSGLIENEVMKNMDVVFIDYVQNIMSDNQDEYQNLSNIVLQLQSFAIRSKINIVLISQISQESQREQNRDILSAKGSGKIGESSDVFMSLMNVDKPEDRDFRKANKQPLRVLLDIRKNRHGPTGPIEMILQPDFGRYEEGLHSEYEFTGFEDLVKK